MRDRGAGGSQKKKASPAVQALVTAASAVGRAAAHSGDEVNVVSPQDRRELARYGFLGAAKRARTRNALAEAYLASQPHAEPIAKGRDLSETGAFQRAVAHLKSQGIDPTFLTRDASGAYELPNMKPDTLGLEHLPGGDVALNLLRDVADTANGIPAGAAAAAIHPIRAAQHIGAGYADTYEHGPGHFLHSLHDHPLGPILDAATIATLGGAAATKAGLLAVPAERSLALEGARVEPLASPNPLTRAAQHGLDRFAEAHPEMPWLGEKDRIAKRQLYEAEREAARAHVDSAEAQQMELFTPQELGVRLRQEPAMRKVARKGLVGLLDSANNITKLALIYLNPTYIPKQFTGNLGFLAVHQGVWAAKNLRKASSKLGGFKPDTLRFIDGEVGTGPSMALDEERGLLSGALHKIAEVQGKGADMGPRRAAWIHEASKKGIKTDEQIQKLRTDPSLRRTRNEIGERAEEGMVKFRGMSPKERQIISRAIFVYPWVKGSARYAGRLALDRPLRADLLQHLGREGHDEIVKRLGDLNGWLAGLIPFGKSAKTAAGTVTHWGYNPASITPFGTTAQLAQTLSGKESPAQFLNPFVTTGIETLFGEGHTASGEPYKAPRLEILQRDLLRANAPARIVDNLLSKPSSEPGTAASVHHGPIDAILSLLGVKEIDLSAAHAPKAAASYKKKLESLKDAPALTGQPIPPVITEALNNQRELHTRLEIAAGKGHKVRANGAYTKEGAAVLLSTVLAKVPETRPYRTQLRDALAQSNEITVQNLTRLWEHALGLDALDHYTTAVGKARKGRRLTELEHVAQLQVAK